MFGFGKKKEDPDRKAFREEFETVTRGLHLADEPTQMAVGHGINMASSLFNQSFKSPSDFQSSPINQQTDYINRLTNMEIGLRNIDPPASLGFGLFKMWLGALQENDVELLNKFLIELKYFSRKGDLSS